MILVWAVPVVAAAVGIAVLLAHMRRLEALSVDLMLQVHATREIREPLAEVREEIARSAPLADRVWTHWADGEPTREGTRER